MIHSDKTMYYLNNFMINHLFFNLFSWRDITLKNLTKLRTFANTALSDIIFYSNEYSRKVFLREKKK